MTQVGGIYQIGTETDLKDFRTLVNTGAELNASAELTADILLAENWEPIGINTGGNEYYYAGTFDGNGKTITGLKITQAEAAYYGSYPIAGLFGVLDAGANVKNVTLADPEIDISALNNSIVGGIAAFSKGTIENCTVSGGSIKAAFYAGGVIGYNSNGRVLDSTADGLSFVAGTSSSSMAGGVAGVHYGLNGLMQSCRAANIDEISAGSGVGGMAGYIRDSFLEMCIVQGIGEIKGNFTGGAFGYLHDGAAITGVTVEDVQKITGGNEVGGLAGHMGAYATSSSITLSSVSNVGEITGVQAVAGLVGYLAYGTLSNSTASSISKVSGQVQIGGIVGSNWDTVTGCVAANLTVESYREAAGSLTAAVGGVAGTHNVRLASNVLLENCAAVNVSVSGTVSADVATVYAGGIVGLSDEHISACVVVNDTAGSVKAAANGGTANAYAGGILGWNSATLGGTLENCLYPAGLVDTAGTVGSPEERAIGNIPEAEKTFPNVASYDKEESADALDAIVVLIDPVERTIESGKNYLFSVTALPGTRGLENAAILWSSSSADVAAVTAGADVANAIVLGGLSGAATLACSVVMDHLSADLACFVTVIDATSDSDDVTIQTSGTDPDNIYTGDEVDITFTFDSASGEVQILGVDDSGLLGSGLGAAADLVLNIVQVTGTAETPGTYYYVVTLLIDGEVVTKTVAVVVQELSRWRGGSSGCYASDCWLLALLSLPFVIRKRRP